MTGWSASRPLRPANSPRPEWTRSGMDPVRDGPGPGWALRGAQRPASPRCNGPDGGEDLGCVRGILMPPAGNVEGLVKALLAIIGWCLLLVLCWPLAVLAIVLWPLLWLLSLPFRLVAISFDALFALLRAILFLPARIFGYRGSSAGRPS